MADRGTSKVSAAQRRALFVEAYISNGGNATQAAISAGYSARSAGTQGYNLLKHPDIVSRIAERSAKTIQIAQQNTLLTIERVQQEIARLAFSNAKGLFRPDGSMIPVHELDDDMSAAIASVEVRTEASGTSEDDEDGESETRVLSTRKVKLWEKVSALNLAARHLGMFEKDNAQQGAPISIKVLLV
jgi:phage terminase small subunit